MMILIRAVVQIAVFFQILAAIELLSEHESPTRSQLVLFMPVFSIKLTLTL